VRGQVKGEFELTPIAGAWVGLFALALFGLLASDLLFGYEGEHAAQAWAYVHRELTVDNAGRLIPRARGGIVDVGQYVPFALVTLLPLSEEVKCEFNRWWYVWVHPFWSAWTIVLIFTLAVYLFRSMQTAVVCALLAAVGTVLFPYSKIGMETQQTLWSTASWTLAIFCYRERRLRDAAVLAFALALLILTKITGVLVCGAVLCVLLWWAWHDQGFRTCLVQKRAVWLIAVGVVAGLAVLLITNRIRYGTFYGARYPWGDKPNALPCDPERVLALLFSPNKSIFLFSPVLVLTIFRWREFFRRFHWLVPVYVALALLTGFHLSMNTWVDERLWFSRLHFLIPFLVLPLGIWWERKAFLPKLYRWISVLIVAGAFAIELLSSAVNYTALTFVVHPSRELTIENLVWNPQYNHLRFNAAALLSWWSKQHTGYSLPFVVLRRYLPAAPPPGVRTCVEVEVFPMKGWDEHDFFLAKELMRPRSAYGRSVARTAIGVCLMGLLLSGWRLARLAGWLGVPAFGDEDRRRSRLGQTQEALADPWQVQPRRPSRKWPWRRKWMVLRIVRGKL